MSNCLLIKQIASKSESFMKFVESHQGSEALQFEGYAYSKVRDGKGLGLSFTLI